MPDEDDVRQITLTSQMSVLENPGPDAQVEKFYKNFIDTMSDAMVDEHKVPSLKDFYLPEVTMYGWFGEVKKKENSRGDVLVSQQFEDCIFFLSYSATVMFNDKTEHD
jgi:hypothetical protein